MTPADRVVSRVDVTDEATLSQATEFARQCGAKLRTLPKRGQSVVLMGDGSVMVMPLNWQRGDDREYTDEPAADSGSAPAGVDRSGGD